jgi:hypothetical protein
MAFFLMVIRRKLLFHITFFPYFKKNIINLLHFIRLYIKIGIQSGVKWCIVVEDIQQWGVKLVLW